MAGGVNTGIKYGWAIRKIGHSKLSAVVSTDCLSTEPIQEGACRVEELVLLHYATCLAPPKPARPSTKVTTSAKAGTDLHLKPAICFTRGCNPDLLTAVAAGAELTVGFLW
jgi:hypothetical protein